MATRSAIATALCVALLVVPLARPVRAAVDESNPFTCSVSVDPGVEPAPVTPPPVKSKAPVESAKKPVNNAISYLLVEGEFQRDFSVAATMTLPRVPANVKSFYANWLLMIPFRGAAFVQLNLIRWSRYKYRNEIALTWARRDGVLVYRDTGLFVTDAPHRLKIAVRGPTIVFYVDGVAICHASKSTFFDEGGKRLYVQVGTEAAAPGERVTGEVYDVAMKDDPDKTDHPYDVRCVYRGYGVSWIPDGPGRYQATGAFDPTQPYMKFEGPQPGSKCEANWTRLRS
jgi:hypothetical protein